jgi:hypothetical protein
MIVMKSDRLKGLRIFTERGKRGKTVTTVFVDYVPVVKFTVENINERRLAAIQLYELCDCSMETAGLISGFHRNTVSKLIETKNLLGIEAVFEDKRGPKAPHKYIDDIQKHIKALQAEHPEWTDLETADQAAKDLKMNISRSAVARIRTGDVVPKKNLPTRQELIDLERQADAIERELYEGKQLQLNFQWDEELKEKCDEFAAEPAPKTDNKLVDRLQAGERCGVAGDLMHHLFLNEIKFNELPDIYPPLPGSTYQVETIFLTLFHSINLRIPSIEALKLVNASEFGVLTGMNRIPEKETIRDHLGNIAEQYLSGDLIDEFARRLLQLRFIDPEVFFIDGHFLPYYGLNVIAKGYYTVRRLAMRGNELYAITDLQGRPLFFINETNEIDFRPIIIRSVEKLIGYGVERPLMVFDRGGYGIHFFNELSQTADFITWARYIKEKHLNSIPESSFTAGFRFTDHKYLVAEEKKIARESAQTAAREGRSKPATAELRLVVLMNADTGKRVGIYTSNWDRPAYMIALYMLERWGESENLFKEMKARFNLDYHPGYDLKELENQPLVENPDVVLTKKAIRILKKEIRELDKDILITEAKLNRRKDKRLVKKLSKLPVIKEGKQTDLSGFESKLETLPKKVSILELLNGKPVNRCDLEKKKIYDWIQFLSYLSRERLVEIFKQCYNDDRDIKQVLDMITSRSGYVKLIGGTLVVILDWIENEKHRVAAEQFCRLLNEREIIAAGRLKVRLFFHMSRLPFHGSRFSRPELALHNFK